MAVYQSRHQWLTLSHRGQAPSHSGTVLPVACGGTGPKSLSEMSSIVRLHIAHNVGGGLPPMAASGPTRMLDQIEYISVSAVTAANGSAFTAAHF